MKSNSHNFIFIHIPKTGGSSIELALKEFSNDDVKILPGENVEISGKHMSAIQIKKAIGEKWSNYYKFAFVRNPYDLMVSYYEFYKSGSINIEIKEGKKVGERYIKKNKDANNMDFNKWFNENLDVLEIPQLPYITDDRGNIIVDFIGRFENLEEDFKKVCKKIGVDVELPHINKTEHKNYREYYNEESKKLVEKVFKKDIELFEYKF